MGRLSLLIVAAALGILWECVASPVTPVSVASVAPRAPTEEVVIFASEKEVKQPFKVVGIINYNNPGKYQILTLQHAIPALHAAS